MKPTSHDTEIACRRRLGDDSAHRERQEQQDRSEWEARQGGPQEVLPERHQTPVSRVEACCEYSGCGTRCRRRERAAAVVLFAGLVALGIGVGCVLTLGGWQ